MNPLTNVKNQNIINEKELKLGYSTTSSSWHNKYKDSAWIYVGGLDYELTEGDLICVFSQYGEIVNINLVRDRKTGNSKGFCFICYEDQKSTTLAADNFNGIKIAGRVIRVDHVEKYRIPNDGTIDVSRKRKLDQDKVDITSKDSVAVFVRERGCGPEVMKELKRLQHKKEKKEKKKIKERLNTQSSDRCPSPPKRSKQDHYDRKNLEIKNALDSKIKHEPRGASLTPPSPPRRSLNNVSPGYSSFYPEKNKIR